MKNKKKDLTETEFISESEFEDLLPKANKSLLKKLLVNPNIPPNLFAIYFLKYPDICIHNTFLMIENPGVLTPLSEAGESKYSQHRQSLKKLIKSKPTKQIIEYAYKIYSNAKYKDFRLWKGVIREIAENENTPEEVLIELSNHSRPEVVSWATKNKSFPESKKIRPKFLTGGRVERTYLKDTAEYIECFLDLLQPHDDYEGYISPKDVDTVLPKKYKTQMVTFIEFTARKRRIEVICDLPIDLQLDQNPAISLNLWRRFKEKKIADIRTSFKGGYLLILTRKDLTEDERIKIRQSQAW